MDAADFLSEECRKLLSGISEEDRNGLVEDIVSSERVFVYGVGRSGLVAQLFAVRMVQMGLRVYFVGDMTTPIISEKDILILVSNTGETLSVVTTAQVAERLGTECVSVTSEEDSSLAKVSDKVLIIKSTGSRESSEIAPLGTLFEDATLLLFDSLVPLLMKRLGVTEEDMRNNHAIWV